MRNDVIKADGQTPAADDPKSRYAISSDMVMCLHLAHPDLPREVEKIFSAKLECQDLASLESDVFTRAQVILQQLEGSTSIRRTVPPSSPDNSSVSVDPKTDQNKSVVQPGQPTIAPRVSTALDRKLRHLHTSSKTVLNSHRRTDSTC